MQTVRPHPAFGVRVSHLEELSCPADNARFREQFAEQCRPCVLRGLAECWPFVRSGRFDPGTSAELQRRLGSHRSLVSFEPGSTLFGFECTEGDARPRLVNPGRMAMPFSSFLDLCDHKRNGCSPSVSARSVRCTPAPYDDDESTGAPGQEAPLDVPFSVLTRLALYCVEDATTWPPDMFRSGPLSCGSGESGCQLEGRRVLHISQPVSIGTICRTSM
eukprot:gnl/TRDRNA2_/TRDRNA2_153203_c0_seq1.p1 gnl/TRDRNA2_/TRDRNA2_153203_c0~~gnl/TRDRNA2_/TRDRNA2_153203_c0_seq1.p1  ORF type:complete len:235 (-),score=22.03 gnl/TRDRNA2_/TRDRNA2_153203_c0_seq1:322-975(-)